ncbi:zinc transporter 1 [Daktulosphaira vitifoliae]|uniref:zinc transporter 1 n=1 Tax=Daktulosphaira vitifoliae TaxID=58002 RepID=UPI0021AAC096|nr:zinc transporter 1 [Daktulosphaira vitifoliae]XP_050521018.1 zinc transporter 1 [Daktulosphaira vitifoliae]
MGRYSGKKCRLITMFWLTTFFFLVEIIVGYITNSMALVADSFHMLSDIAALVVAYLSVKMSPKKWSKNTFGWARAEVLGALVNAVFLVALCFSITVEACKRFIESKPIHDPKFIAVVGTLGLFVNILGLFLFHAHGSGHGHSHGGISRSHTRLTQLVSAGASANATDDNDNDHRFNVPTIHSHESSAGHMNMRGVFLHLLADALGSVIVIVSALIVWLTDYEWKDKVDPALSLLMVIIILHSVWPLLQESALILLQTVPTHIQVDAIQRRLLDRVDGVLAVHEFHVWQLAGDRIIASAHIRCRNLSEYMKLAEKVKEFFHNEGIHSTTIQPEFVEVEVTENRNETPTEDCVLDCPKTDIPCQLQTCCGPSKQGRDTPSPVDTPYLCRQRNTTVISTTDYTQAGSSQENEMEYGALLNDRPNKMINNKNPLTLGHYLSDV